VRGVKDVHFVGVGHTGWHINRLRRVTFRGGRGEKRGESKNLIGLYRSLRLWFAIEYRYYVIIRRKYLEGHYCGGRSCRRPDIEGKLPAMWPLMVIWQHMGQRREG
jgi:hypothetical protein